MPFLSFTWNSDLSAIYFGHLNRPVLILLPFSIFRHTLPGFNWIRMKPNLRRTKRSSFSYIQIKPDHNMIWIQNRAEIVLDLDLTNAKSETLFFCVNEDHRNYNFFNSNSGN